MSSEADYIHIEETAKSPYATRDLWLFILH